MSLDQLVGYIAPMGVVLGAIGWVGSWFWRKFEKRMDETETMAEAEAAKIKMDLEQKHRANTERLVAIDKKVEATNGTVTHHTEQLAKVEATVETLTSVVTAVVGEGRKP